MSKESADARPRPWRRWTLGGLMILIALVALPMAWYVHHAREVARELASAELIKQKLDRAMAKRLETLLDELASRIRVEDQPKSLSPDKPPAAETEEPPR